MKPPGLEECLFCSMTLIILMDEILLNKCNSPISFKQIVSCSWSASQSLVRASVGRLLLPGKPLLIITGWADRVSPLCLAGGLSEQWLHGGQLSTYQDALTTLSVSRGCDQALPISPSQLQNSTQRITHPQERLVELS